MRNTVLQSIEAPGGGLCVDLFRRPDGSHGFELYRRDSEDPSGWYPIGGYAGQRFPDEAAARAAARGAVPWLADLVPAQRSGNGH